MGSTQSSIPNALRTELRFRPEPTSQNNPCIIQAWGRPKAASQIFKAELRLEPLATESETELVVGPNQGDILLKNK